MLIKNRRKTVRCGKNAGGKDEGIAGDEGKVKNNENIKKRRTIRRRR
jgi:hypothetical protein